LNITHTLSVGFNSDEEVALIRRVKAPNYGLRNLPGGKVEEGEDPEAAARREFHEETGHVSERAVLYGRMVFPEWTIGVYLNHVGKINRMPDQEVTWMSPWFAVRQADLVENLRVIIPLMTIPVKGWTYTEKVTNSGIQHQLSF